VEFRTFSRYAHKPRHLLREAYQAVVQKVIADRRVLSVLSLDALDEVVQDRFPGAQWPAAARSWIDRYVHEEDRRSQRYTKLVWYELGSSTRRDMTSGVSCPGSGSIFATPIRIARRSRST
jgi:hypothetical protein